MDLFCLPTRMMPVQPPGSLPARPLDRLRDAVRRCHCSYRTEQTYVHWVKRFIHFNDKRHPGELGEPEVTASLNHLARDHEAAAATLEQALSTLLPLYTEMHGRRPVNRQERPRVSASCGDARPSCFPETGAVPAIPKQPR